MKKGRKIISAEEFKIERTKKLSIKEGGFYSVHDGFGLRYITPYILEIGKNNPFINAFVGFFTSIPSLIGNVSQIFTSRLIEKYSRKKIVTKGVFLQSIMWIFMILAGAGFFILKLNSSISLWMLLVIYTLLILFGSVANPVWTSWMKDIVTHDKGKYFGKRNRVAGIVALVSMLVAGIFLDFTKEINFVFFGFSVLFFIAFVFRYSSSQLFRKHYEPKLKLHKGYYFSFKDFIKGIPKHNFGKFSLFASLFILVTAIASPFFSVYMLNNLGFNYTHWIIVIIASSAASFSSMTLWGRYIDNFGSIKIMKVAGFFIPFVPLLWILSLYFAGNNVALFVYLIIIEAFSGFVWAGYNLSAGTFIYSSVTRERVAICSAYYNVLQGAGIFIGATLGGIISSTSWVLLGLNSILIVFLISGVMRIAVYIAMISKVKEVDRVETFPSAHEIIHNFFSHLRIVKPRPF